MRILLSLLLVVGLTACPKPPVDKPIPQLGMDIYGTWGEPRLVESNEVFDKYLIYTRYYDGAGFRPYFITTKHGDTKITSLWAQ